MSIGYAPLHLAAMKGHKEIVELLLRAGADKDKQDRLACSFAFAAADFGHKEIVRFYCELVLIKINKIIMAILLCIGLLCMGHIEIVEILLRAGADKDKQDGFGSTPLHTAAFHGHKEVVELLLRAGADKDKQDCLRRTPLHLAAESGHKEIVEILLRADANIDAKDRWNQTAYDKAKDPIIKQYIKDAAKRPCNAFVAGLHGRLGGNSPVQLLNGFGFITQFIVGKAVEGYRENQQEAQLL